MAEIIRTNILVLVKKLDLVTRNDHVQYLSYDIIFFGNYDQCYFFKKIGQMSRSECIEATERPYHKE